MVEILALTIFSAFLGLTTTVGSGVVAAIMVSLILGVGLQCATGTGIPVD